MQIHWWVLQKAILCAIELLCLLISHKVPVKQLIGVGYVPAKITQQKSNDK
jgi:hypothetical protein